MRLKTRRIKFRKPGKRILCCAVLILMTFPLTAGATGTNAGTRWVTDKAGTKLAGQEAVTGWIQAGKYMYYAGKGGYLVKGWQIINGKTYYFSPDTGRMLTGLQEIEKGGKTHKYYFGKDGKMHTGWKKIDGSWYCFSADGTMQTGWAEKSGKKYYLGDDGAAVTGKTEIDGKEYTFDDTGALEEKTEPGSNFAASASGINENRSDNAYSEISGNYYQLGSALAVLHADDDGDLDKVKKAVERGFYAVEADVQLRGGTLYCYHTSFKDGTSPTLQETYNVASAAGAKVVMDLKDTGSSTLSAIASFITENQAYDSVIIQTNSKSVMETLNSLTGGTLEYWGLVMSSSSTVSDLINGASSYQSLGMRAVNIPKLAGSWRQGSEENIRKLINAGYEVCVFSWGKFSDSETSNYCSYGASYIMTNSADN